MTSQLRVYQSLWGMEGVPGADEWSVDEKLRQVSAAGFHGIEIPWTPTMPIAEEAIAHVGDSGLDWAVVCFPTSVEHFKSIVERFADTPAKHLNVQANIRPLSFLEGIPFVLECMDVARDAGITVYFETHRDRLTTDLRATLQLIDAIPGMRLVADLSHYVVGQEFAFPIRAEDHALITRILERTSAFHGRIATREQVQIAVRFPQHRPWLVLFVTWWAEGFRIWRSQATPDDELVFVTELGPPPYAITDQHGEELSDRWRESLLLKDVTLATWEAVTEETTTRTIEDIVAETVVAE